MVGKVQNHGVDKGSNNQLHFNITSATSKREEIMSVEIPGVGDVEKAINELRSLTQIQINALLQIDKRLSQIEGKEPRFIADGSVIKYVPNKNDPK